MSMTLVKTCLRTLPVISSAKQYTPRALSVNLVRQLHNSPSNYFLSRQSLNSHIKMASFVQSAVASSASAAHSAFASLASASPIKAGDAVPDVSIKINDLEDKINFSKLQGKNIIVTVPGAFSPTCTDQVPGYVERFDELKAKGVSGVYVVAVNDMFVMNGWKAKFQEGGKSVPVQFAADDAGALASGLGLVLNAQEVFGGPRLKRGAIVIDSGKVVSVAVEPSPGEITVSHADEVLKTL